MKLTLNDKTATYSIFRHDFAGSYAVLDYYRTWRRPPNIDIMEIIKKPPTFYVHELKQNFPIYISINPDYVNWDQKPPYLLALPPRCTHFGLKPRDLRIWRMMIIL